MLIEHGLYPNGRDRTGFTALHHAVMMDKNIETARFLISHGADVNATNMWGHTPLDIAKRWKRKKMAAFLIEQGAKNNGEG